MIPVTVETLFTTQSRDDVKAMLDDSASVFWVDWREDDQDIVRYCEDCLRTGKLSAEAEEAEDGLRLWIVFDGKKVRVPLTESEEDRHITLLTLNQVLAPTYEIRVCVDSNGMDTLAFLPLTAADWSDLEHRFGAGVGRQFQKISEEPNLFTDLW